MTPTNLVLYQFTLPGPTLVGYMQSHDADVSSLYASLPHLLIVVFVEKEGTRVTPLGGYIMKTNLSTDDDRFVSHVLNTAATLQPTATLVLLTKTFQTIKANESDTALPTEADLESMAIHAYTRIGSAGSA